MRNSNIVQTWSMSFSMTTCTIVESLGPNDIYSFSSFSLCVSREMTHQWAVDAASTKIWNISVSFDPHYATWWRLIDRSKLSDCPRIFFNERSTPQVTGKIAAFPWKSRSEAPQHLQKFRNHIWADSRNMSTQVFKNIKKGLPVGYRCSAPLTTF